MQIKPHIFKSYDIRGLVGSEITPEVASRVTRALLAHTGASTLVVARDMRADSPALAAAVVTSARASGVAVIDVGLASTPLFYYAVAKEGEGSLAGIMVTASHNPKEYNGFKLVSAGAVPIGKGSGMEEICTLAMADTDAVSSGENATLTETDVRDAYVATHSALVSPVLVGTPVLVIDAGNGMAGHTLPPLLMAYGLKPKELFFELDGTFPNHEANPLKIETLATLSDAVRATGAALGIAYDGDADRVGFVDETGAPVRGDMITALLAGEILHRYPGAPVLYDVRQSWAVGEAITAAQGVPIMCKVGHAFIKHHLKEVGACFAGELSMHFYFKDFFGVESSDLAALTLLALMQRTGKPLSVLVAPFMRYYHSGELNFTVKDGAKLLVALQEKYAPTAASVIKIDGVRIEFATWWFSVRTSNTEPVVRLNLEAKTKEEMIFRVAELSSFIAQP